MTSLSGNTLQSNILINAHYIIVSVLIWVIIISYSEYNVGGKMG